MHRNAETHQPMQAPAEEQYLGPAEVAHALHVSPKTINRWANEGRIPCLVTLGGHRRFRQSDVDAALEQMKKFGASISAPETGEPAH